MVIIFFTPPLHALAWLPHLKQVLFFSYPTIFSSAPTPAINNDRSLSCHNYNFISMNCISELRSGVCRSSPESQYWYMYDKRWAISKNYHWLQIHNGSKSSQSQRLCTAPVRRLFAITLFQTSQLSRIRRESHTIRFTLTLSRHV
jgi:hypothetical protein